MQAITTKYLPATNTKGSRIKAKCSIGSITVPYPHELSGDACFEFAAKALIEKMGFKNDFVCAHDDEGNFVFVEIEDKEAGK